MAAFWYTLYHVIQFDLAVFRRKPSLLCLTKTALSPQDLIASIYILINKAMALFAALALLISKKALGRTRLWSSRAWSGRFYHYQSPLWELRQVGHVFLDIHSGSSSAVESFNTNTSLNQRRMHELNFCMVVPCRSESTIKHALATGEAKAGCWIYVHLERC